MAPGCFVAGTLTATDHGFVPIEEIKQGDQVWSLNPETLEWELKPVVETFVRDYADVMVTVTVGNTSFDATANHPIRIVDGAAGTQGTERSGHWVTAQNVRAGDRVLSHEHGAVSVTGISHRSDRLPVFNFHVAQNYSYAVTGLAVLVHNTSMQQGPVPGAGKYSHLKEPKKSGAIPRINPRSTLAHP